VPTGAIAVPTVIRVHFWSASILLALDNSEQDARTPLNVKIAVSKPDGLDYPEINIQSRVGL